MCQSCLRVCSATVATDVTTPGDTDADATPSDSELAAGVERLVTALLWRISYEMPSDLSRTGASILRRLQENGPARITALAAGEMVAQPTMSMIIKRLEYRGLVSRGPDPADARATLVEITPTGIEALTTRSEVRTEWFASHLAHLDRDERRTVMSAVETLLRTLD